MSEVSIIKRSAQNLMGTTGYTALKQGNDQKILPKGTICPLQYEQREFSLWILWESVACGENNGRFCVIGGKFWKCVWGGMEEQRRKKWRTDKMKQVGFRHRVTYFFTKVWVLFCGWVVYAFLWGNACCFRNQLLTKEQFALTIVFVCSPTSGCIDFLVHWYHGNCDGMT